MLKKLLDYLLAALLILTFAAGWYLALAMAPFFSIAHGQSLTATPPRASVYCHLCDASEVIKLLPADFRLASNQRLQWALDTPRKGKLILIELSGPCEPVKILWQSKRTNLRSAIAAYARRGETP